MHHKIKFVDKNPKATIKLTRAIPESFCVLLMHKYEDERTGTLAQKAALTEKIEAMQQAESGADEWIALMQDYTKLETLDRPTLLRLIERIEVGERRIIDGQDERERARPPNSARMICAENLCTIAARFCENTLCILRNRNKERVQICRKAPKLQSGGIVPDSLSFCRVCAGVMDARGSLAEDTSLCKVV